MKYQSEFDLNKNLIKSRSYEHFKQLVLIEFHWPMFIDSPEVKNVFEDESEYEKAKQIAIKNKPAGNTPIGQTEGGQRHQAEAICITTMIMRKNNINSRIKIVYKKSIERDREIVEIGIGLGYDKRELQEAIQTYTFCSSDAISKRTEIRIKGRYLNHNETYYERVGIVPDEINWDYEVDQDLRIIDFEEEIQKGHIDLKNSPKGINATSQAHHCNTMIKEQEVIGNKDYVPWLLNNDNDAKLAEKNNNTYGQWADENTPYGYRNVLEVYKQNKLPVYVTRYTNENIIIPEYKNFPVRVLHQFEADFAKWCKHITK